MKKMIIDSEPNEPRDESDLSDEQIKRLDEITDALYAFLKVLAETDDIPYDTVAIWDVVYAGEAGLMSCLKRRVRIPTRVTLKNGTTFVVDYDDEIKADLEDIDQFEHQ